MKVSNSRERLLEMMKILNLKPIDICRKCGVLKSSMSNYINGTREPRQDQISLICDPFGINPAWLMGYDVDMHMPTSPKETFMVQDPSSINELVEVELSPKDENDKHCIERLTPYIDGIAKIEKTKAALALYEQYINASSSTKDSIDALLRADALLEKNHQVQEFDEFEI